MLKRLYAIIPIILLLSIAVFSQETEDADRSNLTDTRLPAEALRILPNSVPSEINDGLSKMVEAGEGKLVQGEREVLAWSGGNYKKANADNLIGQLKNNLQSQGWTYEPGGVDSGVTVFSVYKTNPARRVVLGFYIPTDDALVLAWTEVLSPGTQTDLQTDNAVQTANSGRFSGNLVGTWTNGTMSMMGERNTVTGATTASNGSNFKYVFTADGRFEFVGYMQSTQYGCTTSLFNDKRGAFQLNGSSLTLIPNKNFWRKQNSCAPNSNSEQNYKLDRETFELRTKTDEYGKLFICLENEKGETCYRKEG